ncbi:MAG TPA: hypothetical protein VMI31_11175 [Fimbriimonadaceae bacterium]|nr:hypothetical protein [Fimbriimonadaceae bacterium]
MRTLAAMLLVLATAVCNAQRLSPERAKQVALAFLARAAPGVSNGDTSAAQIERPHAVRMVNRVRYWWSVDTRHLSAVVDDDSGQVILCINPDLESRVNGPESIHYPQQGKPFYVSQSDLFGYAKRKLDEVGWPHGPDVRPHNALPVPDADGTIPRSLIAVDFSDRANGYPVRGGNFVEVEMDSLSGDIVGLQREARYTYAPPVLKITRNQAIEIARSITEVPLGSTVIGPAYQLLTQHDELSERGARLCDSNQEVLGYLIRGKSQDVIVAGDNGEVLSHFSNATGESEEGSRGPEHGQSSAPTTRHPAASPLPWVAGGGLFVLASSIFLALRFCRVAKG